MCNASIDCTCVALVRRNQDSLADGMGREADDSTLHKQVRKSAAGALSVAEPCQIPLGYLNSVYL